MEDTNQLTGLILAGGASSRMGGCFPKGALVLNSKPLIEYSLRNFESVGIKETIIVIRKDDDRIKNICKSLKLKIDILYIVQEGPSLGEALYTGFKQVRSSFFLLSFCDEIIDEANHQGLFNTFTKLDLDCLVGVHETSNSYLISMTYSVEGDKFEEKPENPKGNARGTGNIFLKKESLRSFFSTKEKMHFDLVEILNYFKSENYKIECEKVGKTYFNINTENDYEEAKEYFLKKE